MKEIRKLVIQFTLFYDKYVRGFEGLSKIALDLILFLLISAFGLITLSTIYAGIVLILNPYFEDIGQKLNWTFIILTIVFAISKVIEEFKNKRIY